MRDEAILADANGYMWEFWRMQQTGQGDPVGKPNVRGISVEEGLLRGVVGQAMQTINPIYKTGNPNGLSKLGLWLGIGGFVELNGNSSTFERGRGCWCR